MTVSSEQEIKQFSLNYDEFGALLSALTAQVNRDRDLLVLASQHPELFASEATDGIKAQLSNSIALLERIQAGTFMSELSLNG